MKGKERLKLRKSRRCQGSGNDSRVSSESESEESSSDKSDVMNPSQEGRGEVKKSRRD